MEHQNHRLEKRPRIRSVVKTQVVFSTDRVKGKAAISDNLKGNKKEMP